MRVDVVIPALNEEKSVGRVVEGLRDERVRNVVVVDNGSADATAAVARAAGARVVSEPRRGYGQACLTGLEVIAADPPDVVAFCDADLSDFPEELTQLLDRLVAGADLVVGSRALGGAERGSLTPQQVFGNWLATRLIRRVYGVEFTDLGPFRVIRWAALQQLAMDDRDFGWTVQMQVRAARAGLKCAEIPVRYRPRIGVSKVSGTLRGSFHAGRKILWTIAAERRR
jgi:glycosyltransferase involved in cell wall biosynthesis